jgi:hypothetical protein
MLNKRKKPSNNYYMDDLLSGFVGKALNIPNEQLAGIIYEPDGTTLKPDAVEQLLALDADRIKKLKDSHKEDLTKMHDKGYSKAKAETLSEYEKQLREENGITEELKGTDLIKAIVAKNAKVEIDDEKVKLHPAYINLERKINNEYIPKTDYEKVNEEFKTFKSQIEKAEVEAVVKQDALKVFRSLKPVLSKDQVRATNQEIDFVSKMTAYQFDVQTDGNHIVKEADGKRKETANGHPVNFADFVKSEASKFFDFEQQGDKGNAGNGNGTGTGASITLPATEKEYMQMLANERDPKKASALMKAWQEKNK